MTRIYTAGLVLFFSFSAIAQAPAGGRGAAPQKRIRALVVSGGCCHDYVGQDKILMEVVSKALPVDWTVLYQGGASSDARIPIYDSPDYAKGFDIVVHNECYANISDESFLKTILAPHRAGVPAIIIHCSLHSYRAAKVDDWREFMGATSRRHTKAHNIAVKVTAPDNPIMQGIKADWTTPTDELYVIEKLWPNAKALATAVSPEEGHAEYPVAWTNEYHGARVFGTTLGHGDTWKEKEYQEMMVRAFKWALKRD